MTKLPAPSARAIEAVRPVLRSISSTRQVFGLYPDGHPNRAVTIRELTAAVRELRATSSGDPVIFVARHGLYLGPTLLARESLSLFRLVEAFERVGVEAIEFTDKTTESDLDALAQMLHGERLREATFGGVMVNRIRPQVSAEDGPAEQFVDLRRAYSLGLEVLRETSARIGAGKKVELEAAVRVVEGLTDQVVKDPSHALLLTTIKSYDEYTYYHMVNVALLSIAMGHALGLRRDQVVTLGVGGLLHDVGKVHMPSDVLHHVGKLSEEQWRIVQKHPVDGAGLIFGTGDGLYHPAAPVVLEHHSAYDLSGYPKLTSRPQPSLPARLVSVADCFDAVTSKRAYRQPEERRQALAILDSGAGRGFDPRMVRVFTRLLGLFPVGSLVQLTTGQVGLVTRNHDTLLSRPDVLVVLDEHGNTSDGREIRLSEGVMEGEPARWEVARSLDPAELGIDVMQLVATGDIDSSIAGIEEPTGLVHEPSYGEVMPDEYVDTHNEAGAPHHHLQGSVDPDFHPPFPA